MRDEYVVAGLKRFFLEQKKKYEFASFYAADILYKIADIEAAEVLAIDEIVDVKEKPESVRKAEEEYARMRGETNETV